MKYRIMISILFLSLLAACAPESIPTPSTAAPTPYPATATPPEAAQPKNPTSAPVVPAPTGSSMTRGEVFVDKSELVSSKSNPAQYNLHVTGSLPTPCNALKYDLKGPDAQNRIQVDLYSMVPTGRMCAQVLEPFDTNIPLGNLTSGKYTVMMNNSQVGELVVP